MKVIKRDGRIQEFDIDKVKLTLARVSDEVNEPFTESDIDNLAKSIEKAVWATGKERIHSFEVHAIVVNELMAAGFTHIARAYDDYKRRAF